MKPCRHRLQREQLLPSPGSHGDAVGNRVGLRTDPRFKEIVRELGLVDYWRTGCLHEHPVLHMGRELLLVGRTRLSRDRLVLYVVFELS
jgi:hypothetical protein